MNFFYELVNEIKEDRTLEGAATLSYYITLATFPALITLLAVVPLLPIDGVEQIIMSLIENGFPGDSGKIISQTLAETFQSKNSHAISFGSILSIWAASSGVNAIIGQLNYAYEVKETRSFIKKRLISIMLTLFYGAMLLVTAGLIIFSEFISTPFGPYMETVLQYGLVFVSLLLTFASIYYWAPNMDAKFRYITPGSIFGAVVIVLATLLMDYYISNFGNYDKTYGGLGGIVVYMLWLNISGIVLLVGAQINDIIDKRKILKS